MSKAKSEATMDEVFIDHSLDEPSEVIITEDNEFSVVFKFDKFERADDEIIVSGIRCGTISFPVDSEVGQELIGRGVVREREEVADALCASAARDPRVVVHSDDQVETMPAASRRSSGASGSSRR